MRREQPVELEDLIHRAPLLVQAANAEESPKFEVGSPGEGTAERNIDVRFDRAPFRRKDIEERASRLEHPMYLGVRHFLVHDVLEDGGRKDEVERIVRAMGPCSWSDSRRHCRA